MILIKKFENVFGIKKLIGGDKLDKLNVIYAPNGTAKSSIADALENISNEEDVEDVYGSGATPSYQIDVNGNICDENNHVPFTVIKYSGVSDYELGDPETYKALVISKKTMSKVSASQKSIKGSISAIKNILFSCFKKKGKDKNGTLSKQLREAVSIVAGVGGDEDEDALIIGFIENLLLSLKPLSKTVGIDEDLFYKLVNNKSVNVANLPEVKQNLNEYAFIVSKKTESLVCDKNFTVESLTSFRDHAIEDGYFDDDKKRELFINKKEYDLEAFNKLVDDENKTVYGSEETKTKFEQCKKALMKNKATKDLSAALLKDKTLLSHASDYSTFVNELFVTIIDTSLLEKLKTEKSNIAAEQAKLDAMRSSLDDSDNVLNKIWSDYQSRFTFDKFDLKIRNRFDAVIGYEVPSFVKCIKGTDIEIDDPALLRFSTGEIRSFNLINAIIEIEKEKLTGKEFTIVLDDAVDSFDYKNKYGIVSYLAELKENPSVQIIVLTHNFDFYRTMVLAFGKGNTQQFFMYKNRTTGETELFDTKSKRYYLSVVDFNEWKKSGNSVAKFFAYIPFARNIIQLENNSSHPDVQKIDTYFHYDLNTSEQKDFADLDSAITSHLSGYVFPTGAINMTDSYLKKLDVTASRIISSQIDETSLEKKITLGLYIRLFLERFLSKKYHQSTGIAPTISNPMNTFVELFSQAGTHLSDEEKALVVKANVVAPSYVHANSFMYEPLIDVEAESLKSIAIELRRLNSSWPL